jgi:hypothetical protein
LACTVSKRLDPRDRHLPVAAGQLAATRDANRHSDLHTVPCAAWTEKCLFAIDAQIVRMVYIGGLSTNDPTVLVWTLYGPTPSERHGVEVRHAWLTSRERFSIALVSKADRAHDLGDVELASKSYREELALIENISGLSRRQVTDWLQTSHTTLNGIARSERTHVRRSRFVSLRYLD